MTLKRNTRKSRRSRISSSRRRSRNIRSRRSKRSKRSKRSRSGRSRNMRGGAEPEVEPVLETEIDLPPEVLDKIIKMISFKDFMILKEVNTQYRDIVNHIMSNPVLLKQKLLNIKRRELILLNRIRNRIPIEVRKLLPAVLKERHVTIYTFNDAMIHILNFIQFRKANIVYLTDEKIIKIIRRIDYGDKVLRDFEQLLWKHLTNYETSTGRYYRVVSIITAILEHNPIPFPTFTDRADHANYYRDQDKTEAEIAEILENSSDIEYKYNENAYAIQRPI